MHKPAAGLSSSSPSLSTAFVPTSSSEESDNPVKSEDDKDDDYNPTMSSPTKSSTGGKGKGKSSSAAAVHNGQTSPAKRGRPSKVELQQRAAAAAAAAAAKKTVLSERKKNHDSVAAATADTSLSSECGLDESQSPKTSVVKSKAVNRIFAASGKGKGGKGKTGGKSGITVTRKSKEYPPVRRRSDGRPLMLCSVPLHLLPRNFSANNLYQCMSSKSVVKARRGSGDSNASHSSSKSSASRPSKRSASRSSLDRGGSVGGGVGGSVAKRQRVAEEQQQQSQNMRGAKSVPVNGNVKQEPVAPSSQWPPLGENE